MFGRGAGGEGKDLSLHWDDPLFFQLLIKKLVDSDFETGDKA
jgi:hypothetical protein